MTSQSSLDTFFPSLRAFEAALDAHPEVPGALYTGSLGRGDYDRFSDLDIKVWVPDAWVEEGLERLRAVMGWLGEVQFLYSRGAAFATGFVGPEWRRVDLSLARRTDLKPGPDYAGARVVKDTDGVLARLVAESAPAPVTAATAEAQALIEEAIDSQIYLALHNARGAVWSAMGEVSYRCSVLYGFLGQMRGRLTYGFRYVETLLTPEEQALMTAAWPAAPSQHEVRRAARALWEWTRYVWAEAERVFGAPLGIAVDAAALLQAVERIYASQR